MSDPSTKQSSIFGLDRWVLVGIGVGAAFVLLLVLISLWLASKRSSRSKPSSKPIIPIACKEIQEIKIDPQKSQFKSNPFNEPNAAAVKANDRLLLLEEEIPAAGKYHGIHIDIGKENRISYPGHSSYGSGSSGGGGGGGGGGEAAAVVPEVSHLGWGHWYTLRELEVSTNGFADENVIGEGGYGIVYHAIFEDKSQVAVKNLLNNRGQAEREFKVEVEAIGRVRHKNLVRLLGYCAEGAHRMLVYEYVNNGNLEQWLHGDVGPQSPLTWEIRMNIILGTAKGLTYLHDGLEPRVIHRDVKSSNILLDKHWHPKVSDFGLAKLLGSDDSYITTRVMGTFGYVAPEYASTGMLNERSDVYSFGILIMEIISGRNPVDYSRPSEEVNLVDWLKKMVTDRNPEGVLDPKLPEHPTSRALKRTLLVALRCVDPNTQKRPKMCHIVHMLETEESPYKDDRRSARQIGNSNSDGLKDQKREKPMIGSGSSRQAESIDEKSSEILQSV